MRVVTKEGFKLPFLGKDKFIELMRIGLGYDKGRGVFFVSSLENLEKIKSTLTQIFGEEVAFAQTCYICNRAFSCAECDLAEICETANIPMTCVCLGCRGKGNLYELYVEKGLKTPSSTSP